MRPKNPNTGVNGVIYALTDSEGVIRYIGYTKNDLTYTVNHHRSAAKAMRKATPVNVWIAEIGLRAFKGEVLEQVTPEDAEDRLAYWVENARHQGFDLLNLTKEEHMERVREAMRAPEVRKRLSEANKGRVRSPEWRAKVSAANKGRKLSDEHRANISKAQKGKVVSEETRRKISEKAMGHRRNVGKVHSPEAREKMSRSHHANHHLSKGVVKAGCRWC